MVAIIRHKRRHHSKFILSVVGVLMSSCFITTSAAPDRANSVDDNSGSFSSIFSAISDMGRAVMGSAPFEDEGHSRTSKQMRGRRKMMGFDVAKVVTGADKRQGLFFGGSTPRPGGLTASPTMFSDLVTIMHNGQRQGVAVFRRPGQQLLGISSPHPPPPPDFAVDTTERTFFTPSQPSSFPFDRKVHQQTSFFQSQSLPPPTHISGFPTQSTPSFSTTNNNFPITFPTSTASLHEANNDFDDNLVEDFGGNFGSAGLAPNPEKLIIHVVEQQKLGKLKTSSGPVEQQQQQMPSKKAMKRKNKKKKKQEKQEENVDVELVSTNAEGLVNELRRQGKNAIGPSLTFLNGKTNQNLAFRAGRQVPDKVVVPGFPNGLPNGVPEGVKIALASAVKGANGEFIMNPIPGQAGVDFPVLASVPDTGFDCGAQQFPGIYGDTGADCQVFHMCQPNGNYDSFLCPNGTIFNQQYFICDWWYNVDCAASPNFYPLNEFIYQDQEDGKNCQSLFCIDD